MQRRRVKFKQEREREREKWLPKYGTTTATAIVERTRAVRIRIEHDRYSTESGLCGNSSSKLCTTGVIVNAYLVKGFTTCRDQKSNNTGTHS